MKMPSEFHLPFGMEVPIESIYPSIFIYPSSWKVLIKSIYPLGWKVIVGSIYPLRWKCHLGSIYPSGWKYPTGPFILRVPFTLQDGHAFRVPFTFRDGIPFKSIYPLGSIYP